ncbi:hypothetical protein LJC74_06045 [Eubacteriales bacterium OttesenSCG-928-A19]|nr:hypothetical protein [Eubacteriales bacterium OttesenSCG-928-A19]
MMNYVVRILRVLFGLFLFALGSYLGIQANIGLGAWEAFGVGVSGLTGISYGDVTVLTGVVILALDVALGEPIGIATLLNTLLIGKLVDLLNWIGLVPKLQSFLPGVLMMLFGQFVLCLGVYFYVGAGLGAGPRDSLMVALGKRLPRVPIGMVRGAIEGCALMVGWMLGAKVGVGTIIAVFGIGFVMQATLRMLRFDVKGVCHENILQSARAMTKKPDTK